MFLATNLHILCVKCVLKNFPLFFYVQQSLLCRMFSQQNTKLDSGWNLPWPSCMSELTLPMWIFSLRLSSVHFFCMLSGVALHLILLTCLGEQSEFQCVSTGLQTELVVNNESRLCACMRVVTFLQHKAVKIRTPPPKKRKEKRREEV